MPPAAATLARRRPLRSGATEFPEFAAPADELLSAMASLRRSSKRLAQRPAEFRTLTDAQLDLVRTVLRVPGVSVAQAAEELRLAPNTVSTLVRQLTDQRVLVRRADARDRRVARLHLTPAMARKLELFRDGRIALLSGAMADLSEHEQRRLTKAVALVTSLADKLEGLEFVLD
jgi:DNA-binding MarR family transcriptional regulator